MSDVFVVYDRDEGRIVAVFSTEADARRLAGLSPDVYDVEEHEVDACCDLRRRVLYWCLVDAEGRIVREGRGEDVSAGEDLPESSDGPDPSGRFVGRSPVSSERARQLAEMARTAPR